MSAPHLRLVPSVAHDVDQLDAELLALMDARAAANREAFVADADCVDEHWQLDTHHGAPAIGHDVDGVLVWSPVIGRAL